MTPLIFATNRGDLEALKLIIQYSNVEAIDNFGETALFYAVRLNHPDIGLFLLNNRANQNFVNLKDGNTPLMEAVSCKNVELAKILVKYGANISSKDFEGFTAYDIALQEGVVSEFTFLKPS